MLPPHVNGQRVLRIEGELAELAAVAPGEVNVLYVGHERVLAGAGLATQQAAVVRHPLPVLQLLEAFRQVGSMAPTQTT